MSKDARGLRHDPLVAEALDLWWNAASSNGVRPQPKASSSPRSAARMREYAQLSGGTMTRQQYLVTSRKIYKVLHEIWDSEDAQASAHENWERDCAGQSEITRSNFQWALFELADHWAFGVGAELYASFLCDLLHRIAVGRPPDQFVWRDDDDIAYAGYKMGSFRRAWDVVAKPVAPPEQPTQRPAQIVMPRTSGWAPPAPRGARGGPAPPPTTSARTAPRGSGAIHQYSRPPRTASSDFGFRAWGRAAVSASPRSSREARGSTGGM